MSKRLTASNRDCGCGPAREQGASPYIGKTALLSNGLEIVIKMVDPNNGRRFCGVYNGDNYWFSLKDVAGLR